jgi:hypothetical protein
MPQERLPKIRDALRVKAGGSSKRKIAVTFADAILDRLVRNAYRFALKGPSMGKLEADTDADAGPRRRTLRSAIPVDPALLDDWAASGLYGRGASMFPG